MPQATKRLLSGSTNGRGVTIVATATPGTLLHVAVSGTAHFDEIWIYAVNSSTTDRQLTIEFGGVTDPDDQMEFTVPAQDGLYLVIPGLLLNNAVAVRGFAAAASVIVCHGYVHRIPV